MKLNLNLIILTLSLIGLTRSYQISNEYVNFVSYSDSECSIPAPFGFGYSMASETCTTLDFVNNFLFKVNGGQVSWASYENSFSIGETCTVPNSPTTSYPVNTCIPAGLIYINSMSGVADDIFYYKVTTSSTPYIPSNSYVSTYMGEQCSQNNIVALEYYINNTRLFVNPSSYTYYCDPNTHFPATRFCANHTSDCNPPAPENQPHCFVTQPFYNYTGDSSITSICPTCCTSGSCSATSGGSSGSFTGEGWSKPEDEKQQLIKLEKKDKLFPITNSNEQNIYYKYIYCS
ncbi:hypothetical protein ACTFIZ_007350 [Dictyostelium cf. discoideum]